MTTDNHDQARKRIRVGQCWRRNHGDDLVATVIAYDGDVVQFTAPWSKTGALRKAWDAFVSHYTYVGESNG